MKSVRIASGSAFWGDMLEPAIELAEKADVQYIGFDHLAELTMAILNRTKAKDPKAGYIPDIVPWMQRLLPIARRKHIRLVTNAGGANPRQAAIEVGKVAASLGLGKLRIGVVEGDDILPKIDELRRSGWRFKNLDTGEDDIDSIRGDLVAANAYIGADVIRDHLAAGADVVITGRASDNALYVGPLMHELGWQFGDRDVDRIGAAITVGHIIECAGCVTGGMSNMWKISERPWAMGFPIAEVFENGDAVISKPAGSGGVLNEWTVKEHLIYEVHDPANYLMPDGVADFTALRLTTDGPGRVRVTGMKGKPRPTTLKVCLGYRDGFIGEGLAFFPWPDALQKAEWAAHWVKERLAATGVACRELKIDLVGVDMLHGSIAPRDDRNYNEVGIRVAGRTRTADEADAIRREVTHLWNSGPLGSCFGVPLKVRPVVSLWPSLVPREAVPVTGEMMEVG
jgi:hypothetical protein